MKKEDPSARPVSNNSSTLSSALAENSQYRSVLIEKILGVLEYLPSEKIGLIMVDNAKDSLAALCLHLQNLQRETDVSEDLNELPLSENLLIPPIPRLKRPPLKPKSKLANVNNPHSKYIAQDRQTRETSEELSKSSLITPNPGSIIFADNGSQIHIESTSGDSEKLHSMLAYYDCYKIQVNNLGQLLDLLSSPNSKYPIVIASQLREMIIRMESHKAQFSESLQQHEWLLNCLVPLIGQANKFLERVMEYEISSFQTDSRRSHPDVNSFTDLKWATPTQELIPRTPLSLHNPETCPPEPSEVIVKPRKRRSDPIAQDDETPSIKLTSLKSTSLTFKKQPAAKKAKPKVTGQGRKRILRSSKVLEEEPEIISLNKTPVTKSSLNELSDLTARNDSSSKPALRSTSPRVDAVLRHPTLDIEALIEANQEPIEPVVDEDITHEDIWEPENLPVMLQKGIKDIFRDDDVLSERAQSQSAEMGIAQITPFLDYFDPSYDVWNDMTGREELYAPDDELDMHWNPSAKASTTTVKNRVGRRLDEKTMDKMFSDIKIVRSPKRLSDETPNSLSLDNPVTGLSPDLECEIEADVQDDVQADVEDDVQADVEDEAQAEAEDELPPLQVEVEDEVLAEVEDEIQAEAEAEDEAEDEDENEDEGEGEDEEEEGTQSDEIEITSQVPSLQKPLATKVQTKPDKRRALKYEIPKSKHPTFGPAKRKRKKKSHPYLFQLADSSDPTYSEDFLPPTLIQKHDGNTRASPSNYPKLLKNPPLVTTKRKRVTNDASISTRSISMPQEQMLLDGPHGVIKSHLRKRQNGQMSINIANSSRDDGQSTDTLDGESIKEKSRARLTPDVPRKVKRLSIREMLENQIKFSADRAKNGDSLANQDVDKS